MQTRAEYKRKAAVLVEFISALQQGESAQEAFEQKLSSFKVEVDEALLHMLSRRIEAAKTLEQVRFKCNECYEPESLMCLVRTVKYRQYPGW